MSNPSLSPEAWTSVELRWHSLHQYRHVTVICDTAKQTVWTTVTHKWLYIAAVTIGFCRAEVLDNICRNLTICRHLFSWAFHIYIQLQLNGNTVCISFVALQKAISLDSYRGIPFFVWVRTFDIISFLCSWQYSLVISSVSTHPHFSFGRNFFTYNLVAFYPARHAFIPLSLYPSTYCLKNPEGTFPCSNTGLLRPCCRMPRIVLGVCHEQGKRPDSDPLQ